MQADTLPPGPQGPTQRLDKAAAKAFLAKRLEALGHPADILDPGAVDVLLAHGNGSARKLRAALASTLFLASTENTSRVDRSLVFRALQDTLAPTPQAAPTVRPVRRRRAALGAAALALLAVPVAILWVGHPWRAVQQVPAPQAPVLRVPVLRAPVLRAPVTSSAIPRAPAPVPTAPDQTAMQTAGVKAADKSASAAAVPLVGTVPAADGLPPAAAPPAVVVLLAAGDAATARRAEMLTERLHAAGIAYVETRRTHADPARRPVSYFFTDDRNLAQAVSQVLTSGAGPSPGPAALSPRLVLAPDGLPPVRPGLVEVQLP